jgi:hypothetical protein
MRTAYEPTGHFANPYVTSEFLSPPNTMLRPVHKHPYDGFRLASGMQARYILAAGLGGISDTTSPRCVRFPYT